MWTHSMNNMDCFSPKKKFIQVRWVISDHKTIFFFCRCWCWGSWLWVHPPSSFSKCSPSLTTSFTQSGTRNRQSEKGLCLHCEPVSSSPRRERPRKCRNHSGIKWDIPLCNTSQNSFLSPCCICIKQHECFFFLWQQTFEEAEKGFDETLAKEKGMNRDDRVHGALLILNELVRISSMEGEVRTEFSVETFSHLSENFPLTDCVTCTKIPFSALIPKKTTFLPRCWHG